MPKICDLNCTCLKSHAILSWLQLTKHILTCCDNQLSHLVSTLCVLTTRYLATPQVRVASASSHNGSCQKVKYTLQMRTATSRGIDDQFLNQDFPKLALIRWTDWLSCVRNILHYITFFLPSSLNFYLNLDCLELFTCR